MATSGTSIDYNSLGTTQQFLNNGDIDITGQYLVNGSPIGGTDYPILSDTTANVLYVGGKHHN